MQNTAAALDFQYTSRYNKVYFDPEGGIILNRMLGYLKGYERESVLAPLFKMLEATFDLFVPLVMADIVNVGIAAHDLHYILVRCGLLLLLAFIGLTCSLTAQYFSAKAAVGYSTALRHALFAHIQSLSFSEMDTLGTSTLITRMTSDINQVQSGLNLFLRLFLRSPFVVLGAMVMAFTVNARAAMIFVVTIPLLSVVVFGVMVITRPLYKTVQTRLDRVLGLTRENLTGARVVRAFDKEQTEVNRFEDANALLTKMQLHVGHISALMNPLTYVIINLAIVALLYVGSVQIHVGGMASGDVIALVNYMNQILVELVKLANLIVQVSKALACAGRVQAVLDTKPGMQFPQKVPGEVPAEKQNNAVRFDHVGLTYAGAGAPSLTDISFTAEKGQTIGVIGGTGSGKSSLVSLIPRFYDVTGGSVTVDGIDVREMPVPRHAKLWIALAVLGLSALTGVPVFEAFSPISAVNKGILFGAVTGVWVLLAIVLTELFWGYRVWCRSLCPLGGFYEARGRFGQVNVKIDPCLLYTSPSPRD